MNIVKFIVNPLAGNGRTLKILKKVKNFVERMRLKLDVHFTKYPFHGSKLVNEMDIDDGETIVVIGGDGTIHDVANGILLNDLDVTLGMISCGTGNDIVQNLNIPRNPVEAMKTILNGSITRMDVGQIALSNNSTRYFLATTSFGFDAEVAVKSNTKSKWLPGGMNYIKEMLLALKNLRKFGVKIKIDGKKVPQEEFIAVAIGNGKWYGGGVKVCPEASVTDGLLDITLIKPTSRFEVIKSFHLLKTGRHQSHPCVEMYRAKKIDLEFMDSHYGQADGEQMTSKGIMDGHVTIKIMEKKLPVKINET